MIARNLSMPDIKFIPFRNRPQQTNQPLKKRLPAQLTDCLAQRNFAIDWLYRAQQTLRFSRGSLFLGVALLDKLLTLRMPLTD